MRMASARRRACVAALCVHRLVRFLLLNLTTAYTNVTLRTQSVLCPLGVARSGKIGPTTLKFGFSVVGFFESVCHISCPQIEFTDEGRFLNPALDAMEVHQ